MRRGAIGARAARKAGTLLVLLCAVLTAASVTGAAAAGPSGPPPGTISRLPTDVPNYFYRAAALGTTTDASSTSTTLIADPSNGFLLEANIDGSLSGSGSASLDGRDFPYTCRSLSTPWIRLDIDSYTPQALGCGGGRNITSAGSTKLPLVAIDSTDKLLLFTDGAGNSTATSLGDSIVAVSETTLTEVASWTLPGPAQGSGPKQTIFGMSWYPPTDQLLVQTSQESQETLNEVAVPGVTLLAYDVGASVPAALAGDAVAPVWTSRLPPSCAQSLGEEALYGVDDPVRSRSAPYLFVPCANSTSSTSAGNPLIVRLHLGPKGMPDGDYQVAEVPGYATDISFDPVQNLGFMPYQNSSSTSVMVYDGDLGRFVGQVAVSTTSASGRRGGSNCAAFAVDTVEGRVYGITSKAMVTIDGAVQPVRPGTTYTEFGGAVEYNTLPVLPPTAAHPYPRVLVNYEYGDGKPLTTCGTQPYMPSFAVFADTSGPAPPAPPATAVDRYTHQGPIPPGSQVSATYSATAEAVGMRGVWVGSYGGAVNNTTSGPQSGPTVGGQPVGGLSLDPNAQPLAAGTRDLLAGWVQQASMANSATLGLATALGDGNASTATGVRRCSNAQVLGGCLNQQQASQPSAPDTSQAWPFQTAACFQPGPDDARKVRADGFWVTDSNGGSGPHQMSVPGSEQDAQAEADCAATTKPSLGVAASSLLRSFDGGAVGAGATLSVTSASGVGVARPPEQLGKAATAAASAQARGIRLTLPGGAGISIGEIIQTATAVASGFAGGAQATRQVTIADVSVTVPGERPRVLCVAVCPNNEDAVNQLNLVDPANVHFSLPPPEAPFGANADATVVKGSPAGYLAEMQNNVLQQQYDAQFNSVPAGDGETALLPGLRVSLYYDSNPAVGAYQRDRSVIDFAAVEADAENGIQVFPPFGGPGGGGGLPGGGDGSGGQPGAGGTPGTPGHYIPGTPGHYIPGTPGTPGYYVPGTPAALTNANVPLPGGQVNQPLVAAVDHYLKRALHGLSLVLRDPVQALRFFGLLVVLLAPVLLMARRQQWLRGTAP